MKKIMLFIFLIISIEVNSQNTVLVLIHDTTVVSNHITRLADRDTFKVALNKIIGSFDLELIDSNSTLSNLNNYKSIIIQETSFDASICRYLGVTGKNALKNWLNSGTSQDKKSLVLIGGDLGYNYSRSASPGKDFALSHDLLKFNYRIDNGTLTGQYSIVGVGIDSGNTRTMTNAPIGGGYYPDGVQPLIGSTVLYKYSGRSAIDSVAAVGVVSSGYIGLSLFQDPRYFTNGNFYFVLFELIQYAVANGGIFSGMTPLELKPLTAILEGFYNGTSMISDTVIVELRTSAPPFLLVDETKILLDVNGHGTGGFINAVNGTPYYIVVKHRNAIETWSALPQTFTADSLSYDFTTASNKAFGNNLKLISGKWCIYGGDVNQDGIVESTDLNSVFMDNVTGATGYIPTDLNGDSITEIEDLNLVFTNNIAGVTKKTPP
jgi:hypothetical protein